MNTTETNTAQSERLLTPTEVKEMLGLFTKTNHTLRNYELRGQLHPIRLGPKTLRFELSDVRRLIENARGGHAVT